MQMAEQQVVDITDLAVLGEQFSLRLMQLGFRLMQVVDDHGYDQWRYIVPPLCEVPAGPFVMGSNQHLDPQARGNELPQHQVVLDAFAISTYPLTVAEYAYFVQVTNHHEPSTVRVSWRKQLAERWDHPVIPVTWKDMLAYARWLSQVTGESWRLPSEAQWEKAARGPDGRTFPWGDGWDSTMANTTASGPQMTTPVGRYPQGASPYGVQDMAGNVWEWTSTTSPSYPYQANGGRANGHDQTVLRGGSWNRSLACARAAYRVMVMNAPSSDSFIGGRLVRNQVSS